jgi:hypothetical protein
VTEKDSLAILEEVMKHFYWKARILEGMGTEGDYDAVERAWGETGKWAREVAQFRHAKIQAVRLAADPNAPLLPENMTLEQLRDSIPGGSGAAPRCGRARSAAVVVSKS